MMFAYFHSKGTTPSFNDQLNNLASGILICSTVFISSFGGIPSTPIDLPSVIVFIFLEGQLSNEDGYNKNKRRVFLVVF